MQRPLLSLLIAGLSAIFIVAPGASDPLVATLTYPTDGAVNIAMGQTFTWTSVSGAQAYYLYVGTTAGAKDVINSGELQTTQRVAPSLPDNQLLYARLWTKYADVWRYVDTTFTSRALTAVLTAPSDGESNIGYPVTFQWTVVGGKDSYYLYIGTTVGAKDVVNSGELQTTSLTSYNVPSTATLYARLWTQLANVWRYRDSTFTTAPLAATLTAPSNGQSNVSVNTTFAWSSVANVQAYYLYVGTTVGTNNVVNSGETVNTSWVVTGLPAEQTLYARLWTKVDNIWRYTDSTFTTQSLTAGLISLADGQTNVGVATTFTWNSVANAERYYLYLGTTVGARDIINSGELTATQYTVQNLPPARTLYARLWTRVGGIWRYRDTTFVTQSVTATLTAPIDGAASVTLPTTFQWTAVPNVQAYYLYVGTAIGLNDLVNTGEITQTSLTTDLPGASTVWARLWTKMSNVWRYVDVKFGTQVVTAALSYPGNGFPDVPLDVTAEWNAVSGADRYTLAIGTSAGANDVFQSGELTATSVAVSGLPAGTQVYARLGTRHGGVWRYVDSTFTTGVGF